MDQFLSPEEQNRILEDALATYPVRPIPRDITSEVMARIQVVPAPQPFRLTWNDLAVAIVLSLCVGALLFSLDHLPPLAAAQLRRDTILLYQQLLVNARWLLPAFLFALAGFFVALTVPYLRRELAE
jgi:hypothetical protein